MKSETTIRNINGSWYLRLPPDYAHHIGIENIEKDHGATIIIQDDQGKHGVFISFWKKTEEK